MNANQRCNGRPPRAALLRWFVFLFGAAILASGCRSRSDLVEAELRGREREVNQLRSDLQRSETLNHALESELRVRQGVPLPFPPPGEIIDRPLALMANTVQKIELGRGTGGLDEDKWPGDEALQVVIVPRDGDGSALKAPGHLVVKVFEVSSEGLKIAMGQWDVTAVDLQKTWRSGVFASGYFVKLPWKNWPNSEKLRIVAQFSTLPDNRWFEADKDVTIRMMPGGTRSGPMQWPAAPSVPEGLPPPVDGPRFPTTSNNWSNEPAARIGAAKPLPPLDERLQERLEPKTAKSNRQMIEAPPDLAGSRHESLRVEAPALTAESVSPPVRLKPPTLPE